MKIFGIHFYWQNLNEDRRGHVKGSIIRHGRAWLSVGRLKFGWGWDLWSVRCGTEISVFGEEKDLGWSLQIPLLGSFYWHVRFLPYNAVRRAPYGYDFGFTIHDWAIWVKLFKDWTGGWSSSKSWLGNREFSIHPVDLIFGRQKYSSVSIEKRNDLAAFPEKTYDVTVEITRDTWRRPRWPWWPMKRWMYRGHVECKEGVPFPGKGENSWDCGMDASFGLTCPATTHADALGRFITNVLESREKYGGKGWRPEKQRKQRKA